MSKINLGKQWVEIKYTGRLNNTDISKGTKYITVRRTIWKIDNQLQIKYKSQYLQVYKVNDDYFRATLN